MEQNPERKFYLKHFRAISYAIATYEDFQLLLNHLVEGVCKTFSFKGASIFILDEVENQLFRVSSYGISDEYLDKGPVFVEAQYCALYTGKPELVSNVEQDPRVQYPEAAKKEGILSILSIPVKFRDAVIGVMRIYHSSTIRLHEDDLDSLCVLASQLGVVIEANGLRNFVDQVKMAIENLPPRIRG